MSRSPKRRRCSGSGDVAWRWMCGSWCLKRSSTVDVRGPKLKRQPVGAGKSRCLNTVFERGVYVLSFGRVGWACVDCCSVGDVDCPGERA